MVSLEELGEIKVLSVQFYPSVQLVGWNKKET